MRVGEVADDSWRSPKSVRTLETKAITAGFAKQSVPLHDCSMSRKESSRKVSSPSLGSYTSEHIMTRGRAGAPRLRHGVYKQRASDQAPIPTSRVPAGRETGSHKRPLDVHSSVRKRLCFEENVAKLPQGATIVHPAILDFVDHMVDGKAERSACGLDELAYFPTSPLSDKGCNGFGCTPLVEEGNDVFTLLGMDAEESVMSPSFAFTSLPLESANVAILRMKAGAMVDPPPLTPETLPLAPTPPMLSMPPTRRRVLISPFGLLAKWRPTTFPIASIFSDPQQLSAPDLPTSPLPWTQAAFPSLHVYNIASIFQCNARKRKRIVPFHDLADDQQIAKLEEYLWCHESPILEGRTAGEPAPTTAGRETLRQGRTERAR